MENPLKAAVAAIPCLASVSDEQKADLERLCSMRRFAPDEPIFAYGDAGDALYLVAQGEVEIFTHNNARREIPLETIGIGEVFGEVALFNGGTRTANAKALGETILVRVEESDVSALLSLCPTLRDMLLAGMARRLRVSGENLRRLTTFDINAMKHQQLTAFDRICTRVADILGGVPFLVALVAGIALWHIFKPFHDTSFSYLSLYTSEIGLLITLLVLLSQKRQEKSAEVVHAAESLAIRQTAKELQYLHEKQDAVLSAINANRDSNQNKSVS